MENTGVQCNVCECRHNVSKCGCDLPEIHVTHGENAAATACTNACAPHFCQNYEQK